MIHCIDGVVQDLISTSTSTLSTNNQETYGRLVIVDQCHLVLCLELYMEERLSHLTKIAMIDSSFNNKVLFCFSLVILVYLPWAGKTTAGLNPLTPAYI